MGSKKSLYPSHKVFQSKRVPTVPYRNTCEVLSPIKSPHGCPLNSLFLASVACIFNQTSHFCICKGILKYNMLYGKEKDPLTQFHS